MTKKILLNSRNSEETRVAVIEDNELIDFDSEIHSKKSIKGNVYLAKVVRVEPALQAVFIEYGNEKKGFLSFSEIHPDYYKIPVEDRAYEETIEETEDAPQEDALFDDFDIIAYPNEVIDDRKLADSENNEEGNNGKKKSKRKRKYYNVQEVIQHSQILLVQAIKDERGNKGAAFTTYLALPGQYCVLMPNAGNRNGGVSKRIHQDDDRKRLKDLVNNLKIPEKMSVIIRTAGQERTEIEIKRDYNYLVRIWDVIREKTLSSTAPELIHEEADIVMRSVRDFYTKDVEEIITDEKNIYNQTKEIMKQLSPSGMRKIKLHKQDNVSLFNKYDIEKQIMDIMNPRIELKSGASIVIGQTEALVAIDVNSGRAIRERNIDLTALKTNIEASKEIARQIRLRDLSGLIVIDFIDMYDSKHIKQVETFLKTEMEKDRARVQISNISQFGLVEMSRQRLRSSILETYCEICPHCQGRGLAYSTEYFLSTILHMLEKTASRNEGKTIVVYIPHFINSPLSNKKRKDIYDIECNYDCKVIIKEDFNISDIDFIIDTGYGNPENFSLGKSEFEQEEIDEYVPEENKKPNVSKKPKDDNRKKNDKDDFKKPTETKKTIEKKNGDNKNYNEQKLDDRNKNDQKINDRNNNEQKLNDKNNSEPSSETKTNNNSNNRHSYNNYLRRKKNKNGERNNQHPQEKIDRPQNVTNKEEIKTEKAPDNEPKKIKKTWIKKIFK